MSAATPFPASVEYERALLGGLILNPGRLDEIVGIVGAADFYRPDHAQLFELLREMSGAGEPIEPVTVQERVARGGKADRYGGIAYVVELPDQAPSTANLEYYARGVREKALARAGIRALDEATRRLRDRHLEPAEVLARTAAQLADLGLDTPADGWVAMSAALDDAVADFDAPADLHVIRSGFALLDERAPLRPGRLVLLAARPSMGKTALALNIAEGVAQNEGIIGIFSLEMTRRELVQRQIAALSGIPTARIERERPLPPHLQGQIEALRPEMAARRVWIDDRAGVSIGEIEIRARALARRAGRLDLIVIDYLQLIRGDARIEGPRQLGDVSERLKALAKELGCAILALSQLNRDLEKRMDRRPQLADLRGSGSLEQDADVVLFLGLPPGTLPDVQTIRDEAVAIVAKNRGGQVFDARLGFDGRVQRFVERDARRRAGAYTNPDGNGDPYGDL